MDRTPEAQQPEGTDVAYAGAFADPREGRGSRPVEPGRRPRDEPASAQAGDPGTSAGPTEAEVEAWAERVRLRRQAWVDGPTEDEKLEWRRRERARRLARLETAADPGSDYGASTGFDPYEERRRLERRYLREARLAAEGIGVLMATWPFRVVADLVTAGREWEEESLHPARRRWIPFYDEDV